ncbi:MULTISPECIES: phosphoenolpyruvate--protein phosphotransferase [Thalassospira]|jgi:phosphotransferase system, enzyme I, PtsP|uniref:phosphoenolpyruvate--protein phosphotransferase n=3 Tax=Thalassospira TaxID=168934 RepID=A0A367V3Y9_9PROT|nr:MULTISPECIES: phosphoenolpyruvate--protein phosphotransferase [Thalassospira]KZB70554.1 peptidase [Thalassospira sp. MCCC 1A01148]MBC45441.1 phosphoenolpyruvate--protein phosphotransferase [Thalassospira sp.]MBO6805471.1 phosphoenolpyruvate--protein phosphotransferase [Thalassospira sp.]MBO6841728.1 phosphoenolpyruvate--protein phosphotransferase [Thalassospira sp.]MBS8273847.1 phosphoenolpyruvate--protein phosphotransferase [Thalassospira tepidiphila]
MSIPSAAVSGPRRLLKRVRDVMAGPGTAEERLGQIVTIIAADMVAEVCSVYVMRAGEVLELFATCGLSKEAIHLTRLRVGEGIVGFVAAHARPLNLKDAQSHPNFAYRPETGEEIYHSMIGVPILRGGRIIGVLAVQNRTERLYSEDEQEALENVAMVLAEMVAAGELVSREELIPADGIALLPLRLGGARLAPGIGKGLAVLHEPRIVIDRMVSDDPEEELTRLREAMHGLQNHLDKMLEAVSGIDGMDEGDDPGDILEAYRMIAQDTGWLNRITEAVHTGLTAEAAVQKVHDDTRARMAQVTDPYLRERLHDLEDLANRLLQHLSGQYQSPAFGDLPDDIILVARNIGPAELLDYDHTRLRGLALEEGSHTSHVAIVARALDIPVLGGVKGVLDKVEAGDPLIVDSDNSQLFVRPSEDVRAVIDGALRARAERKALYAQMRDMPARTTDGADISLNVNAGLLIDVPHVIESGADGIGLYRTEIPFMVRSAMPDITDQTRLYDRIFEQAEGRPVVFRTLDVGGDKLLPYWEDMTEENPAMGWRSIRITLDRPAVLVHQLRALIRAGHDRDLYIMFPMIAEVAEFDMAKAVLDEQLRREATRGFVPRKVEVGAMLEVPALIWQAPALLDRVDFLSVGTNDLLQFMFAADRGNPRIEGRYDTLSPSVFAFMRQLVTLCDQRDVRLTICGEMAGRPLEAMALIGLGIKRLSMAPASVGPVKEMVRSMCKSEVERYILTVMDNPTRSLRSRLKAFAIDHGVKL